MDKEDIKTIADLSMDHDFLIISDEIYEKIIYDLQGRAHRDMYTANHKIASSFFGFDVRQEGSYLLGNGVTFQEEASGWARSST